MAREGMQQIFERYDKNRSGAIEVEELRALLADMGLLVNKTVAEADSFAVQQFAAADADKDSKLNLDEFATYYGKVTAPKASEVLAQEMPEKVEALRQVFLAFANFGSRQQPAEEMDGAKFSKLCKDTKLVGRGLTPTDVDLIFMKVKARGERRITFDQFIHALEQCGEKKGRSLGEVVGLILESDGPIVNNATKADFVKFHDDKSYQCGVYGRGGPLTVEVPQDPMAALVSRDASRGGAGKSPAPSAGSRTPGMLTPSSSFRESPARRPRPSTEGGEVSTEALRQVFKAFATFGQGSSTASPATATTPNIRVEMDSARFAKLCRESGLLGGRLTSTAVDLCFTKVKAKGVRKITFKQFMEATELLAQEKGCTVEEVRGMLAACEGPMLNSVTKADYVKFFDDKSTYTGVHVNGGPSTVNDQMTADRLMDRGSGRRLSGALSPTA